MLPIISALKIMTEVQSFSAESALHSVRFSAHRLQVHFFGMEVCCVGRLSAGAVIPCFACSYLANFVTQLLGFKHERYAISSIPDFDARFLFCVFNCGSLPRLNRQAVCTRNKVCKTCILKNFQELPSCSSSRCGNRQPF